MRLSRQIAAVVSLNLLNLPQRVAASLVIIVGTAGVVAVLVSVLAMATGFERTMAGTGHADRVIILASGASSEAQSSIPRAETANIMGVRGIRHDPAGDPIAAAELLAQIEIPRKGGILPVHVALRGVGKIQPLLRPEIHLITGRMFRPGVHELIVGRSAQLQYQGLGIGEHLQFQGGNWEIVGVFASGGASSLDSQVLGDAETLMTAYRRNWFHSVTALLDSPAALNTLKRALAADPTLHVTATLESEYFASQSHSLNTVLKFVGYLVGGIMALGGLFCALNTMYAAVSARSLEIATLRAIGFGAAAVVTSVLVEAQLLAFSGAAVGALAAWMLFDGHLASMGAGNGGAQLAFALAVTPGLVAVGILWAGVIGLIGGLFPALRAARLPIAQALRQ